MLRLRPSVLTRLLLYPAAPPLPFPLHRLLSAAASDISPNPSFAVEDYLVETCGLTRAQALKASTKLSHLKSRSRPDAVLAFLAGVGLSSADVSALVAKDPQFLCAGVDRTLGPNVVELTGLGLPHAEIARLVSLAPDCFRSRSIVSKLHYYLPLFGSSEKLLRCLSYSSRILTSSLEKVVKPNVAFLQECGLGACDIVKLSSTMRWILCTKPERVRAMAARAEAVGVPRFSGMFRQALLVVALLSEEEIGVQMEYLKDTFRWSDAEVGIAVCKFPVMLRISKHMLQIKSEFLISEVGLEPAYIAYRPVMLGYCLESRLRPRYYVIKFLKENGLLHQDRDYYRALTLKEMVFVENLICPHKEAAPHLAEDYASTCRGEVPTRFKFT